MSYIPKLEHCYELWRVIQDKMTELKVYNNETSEWLEETMNNHIVETKEAVIHDIDNCLDILAMYDRKRLNKRI
jgi:hypothetical protein